MKRAVQIIVIALIASVFLSGCSVTDKLTSLKQSFNKTEKAKESSAPTVIIEAQNQAPALSGDVKMVTLFFADASGSRLVAEERQIMKAEGIGRVCLEELIKGPAQSSLKATLPAKTKLLDINIKADGLAIVDFNSALIKDLPVTANAEKLAVYSIVNTLTQFPTVQKVEFRVDGKKVNTLLGNVKLDEYTVRNTALIK